MVRVCVWYSVSFVVVVVVVVVLYVSMLRLELSFVGDDGGGFTRLSLHLSAVLTLFFPFCSLSPYSTGLPQLLGHLRDVHRHRYRAQDLSLRGLFTGLEKLLSVILPTLPPVDGQGGAADQD